MKIVFFGTPSFVIPVLECLYKNFNLVGVVTTPDTIQGRKKILTPSPVKKHAIENLPNAKILTSKQYNNITIKQLNNLNPDLFVVAAFGYIIPKDILSIPKHGSLNIHPSLLPKHRGASPIQSAILDGDKKTGITIIQMDEQLDHGPIVAQESLPILGNETFESLHHALFLKAAKILPKTIKQYISKTIKPIPQEDENASFCKKVSKEDGYFDINKPPSSEKLDRMIRAYYPWPTAWTKIRIKNNEEKIMKLLPEKKIQLEGGKPMGILEFLNGYPELKESVNKLLLS